MMKTTWLLSIALLSANISAQTKNRYPMAQEAKGYSTNAAAKKPLVDLNSALPEQLAELPGVGPEGAKAIMKGRPYLNVEELSRAGFNKSTIEKLSALVMVKSQNKPR
jgi:DNA uptake protein ComE-like DNA-binding protein